jgi:hypothetical protein
MGKEVVHRSYGASAREGPTRTARLAPTFQWSLVALGVSALLAMARVWSFARLGWDDVCLLAFLSALCVWPAIEWHRRGMNWLPIGEVFCALHMIYYVLPCLRAKQYGPALSGSTQTATLVAVTVFLASFLGVYCFIVLKRRKSILTTARVLRRSIAPNVIWMFFGLWLVWCILLQAGLLPNFRQTLHIFWSLADASGIVSLLYLSFQAGRRTISTLQCRLAIGGLVSGILLNIAGGYLNGAVQWFLAVIVGFTLGRKRVPVFAVVLCLAILTLLQAGKGEFRKEYWGKNMNGIGHGVNVVEAYSTWLGAGWSNLWRDDSSSEGKGQSLTERADLFRILATAITTTPDQKPFLAGESYFQVLDLIVPRIFWPNKPSICSDTALLGIYIGIQTNEGARSTSISVGPICEAWLNFGWIGLVVAGAFLGVLFGLPVELTKTLDPGQVGWLVAAICLVNCVCLELTIVAMLSSLFTALVAGLALLFAVSREAAVTG